MQTQTKQVQFTSDNIMKCQCTKCPVQDDSTCVAAKMRAMQAMQAGSPGPGAMQGMPSPQDVPGVYCSTGQATCGDLDFNENCVCPTCAVWTENSLESQKYCRNGAASMIG